MIIRDGTLRFIIENDSVENILLTFRSEDSGLDSAHSLIMLANDLSSMGKNVFLVLQAPILPVDISKYFRRTFINDQRSNTVVSISRSQWMEIYSDVYTSLTKLNEDVIVVDLANVFCDKDDCFAIKNNVALYFDDDHMSVAGARLAASYILEFWE